MSVIYKHHYEPKRMEASMDNVREAIGESHPQLERVESVPWKKIEAPEKKNLDKESGEAEVTGEPSELREVVDELKGLARDLNELRDNIQSAPPVPYSTTRQEVYKRMSRIGQNVYSAHGFADDSDPTE